MSPRRLRLLHFDLKTVFSYGDQLLFESVRDVFNGFGGGRYFEAFDSVPLRQEVGPSLIEHVNTHYDAVVVGGGGLFLRSTNPNPNSGWQWNISIDALRRLEVPVVVFAVGNTRFFGQADFDPVFADHLAATIDASVFFGLRNTGSIESISQYVDAERARRIELQPCPTTIAAHLYPDLVADVVDEPVVGLQLGLEEPHRAGGLTPDVVFPRVEALVRRLQADGFRVVTVAHKRGDLEFQREVGAGLGVEAVELFRRPGVLYSGLSEYAALPVVVGARGHAQMIPFGLGNVPVSMRVNPKVEFFAADVGHPEWVVDPRLDDFAERAHGIVVDAFERRHALRTEILRIQERLLGKTLANLAQIHESITGVRVGEQGIRAYSPFERDLALSAWTESYRRRQADERGAETLARCRSEITGLEERAKQLEAELAARAEELTEATTVGTKYRRAHRLALAGDIVEARRLIALADALDPAGVNHGERPRWSRRPFSWLPAPVLARLIAVRRRRRPGT